LPEERAWLDEVIGQGYIDTFRHFYPDRAEAYTYWSMRQNARERNVGWRLDYFFVSPVLKDRLVAAEIHADVMGSDHCPISLELS
jgi:exodeoxyribonuclease-3